MFKSMEKYDVEQGTRAALMIIIRRRKYEAFSLEAYKEPN